MKKAGDLLKDLRGGSTQQKLANEMNVSREAISRYETSKDKINVNVAQRISKKYDDPRFAMTLQHEYTSTGPIWLDGPNIDLHRSAVKEKTLEELEEAIHKLRSTSLVKPMNNLTAYELHDVREALNELVEAQTAISHLVAVVCMEANINYAGLWENHYRALKSAGYVEV